MQRNERLDEVDLLRAVALIGIGVIHAGAWLAPWQAPPGAGPVSAASGLARFSVPAFVFASGFVLWHAYGGRTIDRGQFLRRRWSRVLLPWLSCVPLFLLWDVYFKHELTWQPGADVSWLAFGPGHLYFLLLIAQLYLAFLILPRGIRALRWFTGVAVLIQLGLMAWRSHGLLPEGALVWPAVYLAHEEAPFWLGTFALGCLARAEWPRLAPLARLWPLWLALSAAAGALLLAESGTIPAGVWRQGNDAYLWPARLPQTVVWSLTLLWLGRAFASNLPRPLVRGLSSHSLGIYLLHPIFLDLLGPRTVEIPPPLRLPLLIAGSFAAAYAAVRLLSLTRPGALAIGEQPRLAHA